MTKDAGDPEDFSLEDGASLAERVASLELQVSDLNQTLDNLTTEFVRLRLRLEDARNNSGIRPAAQPQRETVLQADMEQATSAPQPIPPPPAPIFPAEAPAAVPPTPSKSLEERLGSQVFNAVGILALIFGASWALKLAIEHGLIGPTGRILIGLATGAGLVLWSERFRRKNLAAFSYSLKAVGSSVLYLSLWAAFQLYHLLPAEAALSAMVIVTAWNAFMALSQDSELLAAYALVGGFLTPVLLSSGGDHETFLFTYLAIIDLGVVLLLRFKPWQRLLPLAFPATVFYFISWYASFFHPGGTTNWDGQSTLTLIFAVIFGALFASVQIVRARSAEPDNDCWIGAGAKPSGAFAVLLPLANAVFLGCALYSVVQDSGMHSALAWIAVTLAAIYLGLMRLQATAVTRAVHLAIAIILLTVAIPLKASGHTLTTAWLVEGIVLFWLSTRFPEEEDSAARILRGLSTSGYALGLSSLCLHWTFLSSPAGFFTANLASALIAVASLSGAIYIARRSYAGDREARRAAILPMTLALLGIDLVGLLLAGNDGLSSWASSATHPGFVNVNFANAVLGLMLLAAATWAGYRLAMEDRRGRDSLLSLAGATLILFNLAAILAIEHEISALFYYPGGNVNASLGCSLSISAFLMAYGAGLLALGFWRRVAFIRWQALILLIFTIAKVFLYDISGLSQGYRVASFIGLGVLLLAVSFAYQKDWLNLKGAKETPVSPADDSEAGSWRGAETSADGDSQ